MMKKSRERQQRVCEIVGNRTVRSVCCQTYRRSRAPCIWCDSTHNIVVDTKQRKADVVVNRREDTGDEVQCGEEDEIAIFRKRCDINPRIEIFDACAVITGIVVAVFHCDLFCCMCWLYERRGEA